MIINCNNSNLTAFGIYIIENTITKTVYVGSCANTFRRRLNNHLSQLRGNRHPNPHLQNAWNKYGEKSFSFSILEIIRNQNRLLSREQYWLDKLGLTQEIYNAIHKVHGHWLGKRHSKNTIIQLIEYNKKNPSKGMLGKHHSIEVREKLRAFRMGRPTPQSTKDKLRITFTKMHAKLREPYPELINIYTGHIHPAGVGFARFCRMHKISMLNASFIGKMVSGKKLHCYGWMPIERYNKLSSDILLRMKSEPLAAYNRPSQRKSIEAYTYDPSYEID